MKRYFSFQLFKDGFRQLKLFGIFSTIIIGLVSIFVPISTMLSEQNGSYTPTITGVGINVLLLLCTFVLAPIFTLSLFSFLNKRNTSDFYHSIPLKRTCIYTSYIASIMAWITIIIVVNLLLSYMLYSTLTSCVLYNRTILTYALNVWIGSLYCVATVSLAMCISGTTLTNIVVSGIILFLPRIYICMLSYCICDLSFMNFDHFIPILTPSYDIVFGSIASMLGVGNGNPFYMLSSSIYTFCLALIFFALAIYLFSKRKSETAGCAAPSNRLQHVYRILVAFVVCLIPIGGLSHMIITMVDYEIDSYDILMLIVFYVIALLVYFVYEIITTKKLRNLPKTLPGLGVLILMNVLSLCIIQGGVTLAKSFTPALEEIDHVYIIGANNYNTFAEKEYYSYIQSKVKLEDNTIKEIISKNLKEEVNQTEKIYFSDYYTVKIKAGSKTCYRNIRLNSTDLENIHKLLEANKDYQAKFVNLPDYSTLGTSFTIHALAYSATKLSGNQKKTLYESVQKEIKELGYNGWYERLHTQIGYSSTDFYMTTFVGTESCSLTFPLEILPNSFLLFTKMMTNDNTIAETNRFLENPMQYSSFLNCSVTVTDLQTLASETANIYYDEEDTKKGNSFASEEKLIESLKKFVQDSNYEDYANSRYVVALELFTDTQNITLYIPIKGNANFNSMMEAMNNFNSAMEKEDISDENVTYYR